MEYPNLENKVLVVEKTRPENRLQKEKNGTSRRQLVHFVDLSGFDKQNHVFFQRDGLGV